MKDPIKGPGMIEWNLNWDGKALIREKAETV